MSRKKERQNLLQSYWSKSTPHELDVVDKGDHLQIASGSNESVTWWMGTLRAKYPQDQVSAEKEKFLTMRPDHGVTLKLNRCDGTLKIKGRKHLQWFKENFDQILESGSKECEAFAQLTKCINMCLRLDDKYTVPELLHHLPPTGAIKHGPTYIYRVWKGLLDQWLGNGGKVYIITPLIDSKRLADIFLLCIKHRLSLSTVQLFTMSRCDGEIKYEKVYKNAKEMIREIKAPNKKRLVAEERLKSAEERIDTKFGVFHCKIIAVVYEEYAEMLTTSASFHKWHFEFDHCDMLMHFKMPVTDFNNHYLEPLGLAARCEPPELNNSEPQIARGGTVLYSSSESLPPPPPPPPLEDQVEYSHNTS